MFEYLKRKLGIVDDSEWWKIELYGEKSKTKSENPLPSENSLHKSEKKPTKIEMEEPELNSEIILRMTQAEFDKMDTSSLPPGKIIYIMDTDKFCIG